MPAEDVAKGHGDNKGVVLSDGHPGVVVVHAVISCACFNTRQTLAFEIRWAFATSFRLMPR